jgi:hypothetical protein
MREAAIMTDTAQFEPGCRYLIVVPASDDVLFRYLVGQFEGDPLTRVIYDRRGPADGPDAPAAPPVVERRLSRSPFLAFGVAVFRLHGEAPTTSAHDQAGRRPRATMEGIEDRQRVDRWLEESQYLIGRMIPAYLDDRDRARTRLESVEQDNERLRIELADARREITELRGDLDFHRSERARIAENFHGIIDHLTALQGPLNDISSRLQTFHPTAAE